VVAPAQDNRLETAVAGLFEMLSAMSVESKWTVWTCWGGSHPYQNLDGLLEYGPIRAFSRSTFRRPSSLASTPKNVPRQNIAGRFGRTPRLICRSLALELPAYSTAFMETGVVDRDSFFHSRLLLISN
jgi:hypothetical protein